MYHLVILAVAMAQNGDIGAYKKVTYAPEYRSVEACTADIPAAMSKMRAAFPQENVVAVICEDLAKVQTAAALYLQKRIEKSEHTLAAE